MTLGPEPDPVLERAGAGVMSVTELPIGQHVAALAAGQIDAVYTLEPTGTVDAAINDNAPLLDFANKNAGFTVTQEFDTGEEYGLAVRTGNTALIEEINGALADARADGTYDTLFEKWFGSTPPAGN